jgi:hypothetical protein
MTARRPPLQRALFASVAALAGCYQVAIAGVAGESTKQRHRHEDPVVAVHVMRVGASISVPWSSRLERRGNNRVVLYPHGCAVTLERNAAAVDAPKESVEHMAGGQTRYGRWLPASGGTVSCFGHSRSETELRCVTAACRSVVVDRSR